MNVRSAVPALAVSLAVAASAHAAAVFTSGVYTQNFDSMGTAGTAPPADWTVGTLGGTNNRVTDGGGTVTSAALVPSTGTETTAGASYNYGSTGSSDRAVGNVPTTSSGDRVIQLALTNNTGAPITEMFIEYTGEQWRQAQGISSSGLEKLRVYYSTSPNSDWNAISALEWTAPKQTVGNVALDGNLAANRNVLSTTYTLPNAIAEDQVFYLRWLDWNDNGTNDHALAIDDVTVSVELAPVPEPASLSLLMLGAAGMLARRRTR